MSSPEIPADLLERAVRTFGDKETARAWFYRPNLNLLGRRSVNELELGGQDAVAAILDTLDPLADDP